MTGLCMSNPSLEELTLKTVHMDSYSFIIIICTCTIILSLVMLELFHRAL